MSAAKPNSATSAMEVVPCVDGKEAEPVVVAKSDSASFVSSAPTTTSASAAAGSTAEKSQSEGPAMRWKEFASRVRGGVAAEIMRRNPEVVACYPALSGLHVALKDIGQREAVMLPLWCWTFGEGPTFDVPVAGSAQ